MKTPTIKFNIKSRPEFFKELHKRVNQHFKDNNISKHANFRMVFKTIFMICLYFVPFILMLTGVVSSLWPVLFMWVLMGFGMSGIGLSVMHDSIHGAYSKNKRVNATLGYLISFIGGFKENWRLQHNVLHHSFTNIDGYDEDIKQSIMRFSPTQERKKMHRYQFLYAPFLYSLMTIYWFSAKDFVGLIRYKKNNLLEKQGLNYRKLLTELIINKTWYVALFLILPIILISLPWWQVTIGFVIMHFICGLMLALIFQPAHVIEETSFYKATDNNGSMENSWAVHQMKTTANFANRSVFLSWFVGGLNYQIEHHLFPNICHVHYRKISGIVKKTAQEFNVPYHQHDTFFDAVTSHFKLLYQLGTGRYERKLI